MDCLKMQPFGSYESETYRPDDPAVSLSDTDPTEKRAINNVLKCYNSTI
jgi:hypothetical protein